MQIPRLALAVSILFLVDVFFNLFLSVAEAQEFPFEKPLVKLATGTITSSLLEKLLKVDSTEKAKCALSISNNLTRYKLIDPFVYLAHGEHPVPVPLKIETNSTVETLFEAERKDTSGLLFYKIETAGHFLVIFWKVSEGSNRFYVDIIKPQAFSDNEENLKKLYSERKSYSKKHIQVDSITVIVPGLRLRDALKVTIRTQMTTEKDGKLTVTLTDNLAPVLPPHLSRRVVTPGLVAVGLATTVLKVVFKMLMKYIPKEQTGTISLENLSKEMSLINPSWYIAAGHTSSIVPWEIEPSAKGVISWRSPLGGTKLLESFTHTVHFLSYQIDGTNYHVVIGTAFPFKVGYGKTIFTIFVIEKKVEAQTMSNILSIVTQGLQQGDINKLISHLNGIQTKFILDSIPDGKIYGIESKKTERYYEWQYPIFTPTVNAKPGKEYHVKIVAAIGFGNAVGLNVRVEVLPGKSLQETSFQTQNPQVYQEPPSTTASLGTATTTMISGMKTIETRTPGISMSKTAMPNNEIQSNLVSVNGNPLAGTTKSEARVTKTSTTHPTGITTNENFSTTAKALGINVIQRSGTKRSERVKQLSALAKPSFGRIVQTELRNIDHTAWHKSKRKNIPSKRKEARPKHVNEN